MSVHTFKIEDKIRNDEHFSDDEKQALLNALRGGFLEVYSPDFLKKLMEQIAEADDRQPAITKDELKDEIAKLASEVRTWHSHDAYRIGSKNHDG